jgi:membrane associated rhomboid family serine protease
MARADLYVVCKNPDCGAEVSPYVTECPYCGTRLRKRAPKLDRGGPKMRRGRSVPVSLGRLHPGEIPGIRGDSAPYVTAAIVIASATIWVLGTAGLIASWRLTIAGPVHADWWRPLTAPLTYYGDSSFGTAVYEFATLLAVAVFGSQVERRHGPVAVLALFLIGASGGAWLASVVEPDAIVAGANGGALALLCAWAVPDLIAHRHGQDYEGDLMGAAAFAVVLLMLPVAIGNANAIQGGFGVIVGYLGGLLLVRLERR